MVRAEYWHEFLHLFSPDAFSEGKKYEICDSAGLTPSRGELIILGTRVANPPPQHFWRNKRPLAQSSPRRLAVGDTADTAVCATSTAAHPFVAQTAQSISICPNRRRAREFLVLVLVVVLVIGNGAIEDENEDEDEDDLVAAWPRYAVSRVANPPRRSQRNDRLSPSAPAPTGGRRSSRHGYLRYNRHGNSALLATA